MPVLRRRLADRAHVFERMHARELLVRGERRLVPGEVWSTPDAISWSSIAARRAGARDDAHPCRASGSRRWVMNAVVMAMQESYCLRIITQEGTIRRIASCAAPTVQWAMLLRPQFQAVALRRSHASSTPPARSSSARKAQIRLALACMLARGHLLIEDRARRRQDHARARARAHRSACNFQRIQFTSDMLPADIIGVSIYDRDSGGFKFHPGPIFAQVDPRRRGQPRHAQDAERAARGDGRAPGHGRRRDAPRCPSLSSSSPRRIPSDQVGTFPLPESQLDRFLMRIELGYPGPRRRARAALGQPTGATCSPSSSRA